MAKPITKPMTKKDKRNLVIVLSVASLGFILVALKKALPPIQAEGDLCYIHGSMRPKFSDEAAPVKLDEDPKPTKPEDVDLKPNQMGGLGGSIGSMIRL